MPDTPQSSTSTALYVRTTTYRRLYDVPLRTLRKMLASNSLEVDRKGSRWLRIRNKPPGQHHPS